MCNIIIIHYHLTFTLKYYTAIVLPKRCHASGKLKRVSAKDALTVSSPECGGCQVDMLEALGHIVAQEGHLLLECVHVHE